jgi:hypothetical protein
MTRNAIWLLGALVATGLALTAAGPVAAEAGATARGAKTQAQEERLQPMNAEKAVDRADTVTVLAVKPDTRRVTVETSHGPVSYLVDAHTVVRSGAKTIPFTDLQPGDRIAVTLDTEPEVQPPPAGRLRVAREIEVVVNPPPVGAPGAK